MLLQTDENGWVSSKRLYEFLGLDPTSYSKWLKDNIVENDMFEENVDYEVFGIKSENPQGGRPSIECRISVDIAKYLAINSRTKRGKEVRKYYLIVESNAAAMVKQLKQEVAVMKQEMLELIQSKTLALEEKSSALESRLNNIDGGETVPGVFEQKWADEAFERVQKLAERSCHGDYKRCIGELVRKIEDYGFPFSVFSNMFHERHPNAKQYRLRVIAEFDQLRETFDRVYDEEHRFWFNEDDAPYYDDLDPWEDEEEQIVRLSDGEPI